MPLADPSAQGHSGHAQREQRQGGRLGDVTTAKFSRKPRNRFGLITKNGIITITILSRVAKSSYFEERANGVRTILVHNQSKKAFRCL